ncbi:MAG: HU family DNA-binding protein [Planctomycetota bacterium]
MTKKDIVRTISDEVGLTQQQTKKIVQRTFDSIIDTLVRDGRIELRNFGVFEVKSRAARRARNPKTGDEVIVPEKHVVTFKPGKYMEARVQDAELGGEHQTVRDAPSESELQSKPPSNPNSGRWDED